MKKLACLLAWLICATSLLADQQVRQVQEELRQRNLFFGEIDGRQTPELTAAIRKYQERKGFQADGDLNPETLHSLDLGPPGPQKAEPDWPDVMVLKSDRAREAKTESTPAPISEEPVPPAQFSEKSVRDFIESYLRDAETNHLQTEMSYYAEPVDYFDQGIVDLRFVERDVQNYYKRWPTRKYELTSFAAAPSEKHPGQIETKFRIRFSVKNAEHSVSGMTDNVFMLKPDGTNFKIVSMREQRVRAVK